MDYKNNSALFVDDDPLIIKVIKYQLIQEPYKKYFALNAGDALEILKKNAISVIVCDMDMPTMNGIELIKIVKEKYPDIIRIFLTGEREATIVMKAINSGEIYRYITKPWDNGEFKNILYQAIQQYNHKRKQVEYLNELIEKNREIAKDQARLKKSKAKYEMMAKRDFLTNLSNRRDILEKIMLEKERIDKSRRAFSIIIGDIDDFKKINDTHGHQCGDFVLKKLGVILNTLIRNKDSVSRWGGEEFLFLLTKTGIREAKSVAERIRKSVNREVFTFSDVKLVITMTFGISECKTSGDIECCIKRADEALYEGKKTGKNRVVTARDSY